MTSATRSKAYTLEAGARMVARRLSCDGGSTRVVRVEPTDSGNAVRYFVLPSEADQEFGDFARITVVALFADGAEVRP